MLTLRERGSQTSGRGAASCSTPVMRVRGGTRDASSPALSALKSGELRFRRTKMPTSSRTLSDSTPPSAPATIATVLEAAPAQHTQQPMSAAAQERQGAQEACADANYVIMCRGCAWVSGLRLPPYLPLLASGTRRSCPAAPAAGPASRLSPGPQSGRAASRRARP